ncbi:MAG TPA: MHYT domain-containing protein [Gemmatimonadaceae bacterium]|nr:MHYT domain-containing protein [Gemmatimonadaceae bacterium]
MNGTHESPLVALSVLIAMCASYTALALAGRVAVARGRTRLAWLLGGSVAMGSGIWSMHFVAMLAFHLPVPIEYDVPFVALSYLAAVGASAFALFVASRSTVGTARLSGAGLCLGLAIVTMHYTGMAAVRVDGARFEYDPTLVGASVLIAITAATVALRLFLWLRSDNTPRGRILRIAAAVVMGLAISGMHYTAMAAVRFTGDVAMAPMNHGFQIGTTGLAVPVVMGAFVILILTIAGSITDHWVRVKLAGAEALQESEERYRSVISEIDEVIFRTDASGRWTFLNAAWTQITGYAVEETLGHSVYDSVHEDDRADSVEKNRTLGDGTADYCRYEVRYRTHANGDRWVEVHARATRDASGQLIGTAGVIRDVTERRRTEDVLRAARETAEAASRAKSEFLSRMSHELRTPLNAILGFGQLIELDATTPGMRESGDQILKAGRHLLSLINEVLDITRIESGRLHMSAEPVRVGEVVREIIDLVSPLTMAKNINLTVDAASVDDRYVQADRQRLKQVLLNLVANAVKYNNTNGRVRLLCEDSNADRLRIIVEDNGPGIAPAMVTRLFTPFDRLGAEQTDVEGTGLGLALSKRLADAMGGEIGLTTELGSGTRFWIDLPVTESQLSRLGRLELETPAMIAADIPAVKMRRILYVEDNLSNLTLVQRILGRRHDIELIPSMQGGMALELARLHRPDLILLDLHLPDIPGEQVFAQLRKAADCRDIPVVVLSADATRGQIDRLIAAGVHAYITKPLDVKPFIEILDQVLDGKRAA